MERRALKLLLQGCGRFVGRDARHLGISSDSPRFRIDKYGRSTHKSPDFCDTR